MAKRSGRTDDERQLAFGFDLGESEPVEPAPSIPIAESTPAPKKRRHDVYFALVPGHVLASSLIQPAGRAYLRSSRSRASVREEGVLHMSLVAAGRYYDEVPEDDIANAVQAGAAVRFRPFRIVLDRIESWNVGRNHAAVLSVGEGADAIAELCEAIALALQDVGIRPRGWAGSTPHLTFAYTPEPGPEQTIEPIGWTVRDFVLIRNWYGEGRHDHLGRWVLAGR